tara:strand:+ start:400 stop:603 length:204 start_codon:yes stop_codon:yes gene_type:complete
LIDINDLTKNPNHPKNSFWDYSAFKINGLKIPSGPTYIYIYIGGLNSPPYNIKNKSVENLDPTQSQG